MTKARQFLKKMRFRAPQGRSHITLNPWNLRMMFMKSHGNEAQTHIFGGLLSSLGGNTCLFS